jgi:hypothetical protein
MYGSFLRSALPASTPGIQYLSYKFTEPRLLGYGLTPPVQGLYAIVTPDASFKPRPFKLLYIGETENLNDRVTTSHEKCEDWKRAAGTGQIFVAYFGTIGMANQHRKTIEGELIAHYNPPCNIMLRGLRSLYKARTTY